MPERDTRTGQPTGLLTLAYELLRQDALRSGDEEALREHLHWLERHVPIPDRYSRNRNASHKETHGLSWMKATAAEAVAKLHAVAEILRRYGHPAEMVRSTRPGYVVYEDDFQVVAEPFHGEAV